MPRRRCAAVRAAKESPKPRRKKRRKVSHEGEAAPRRITSSAQRQAEMENMQPALEARCRRVGWKPTEENRRAAGDPAMETRAGQIVAAVGRNNPDLRVKLTEAMTHVRRVRSRYLRAIAAPSPNAKCATIEVAPEKIEAPEIVESRPDLLTDEEEYRRALAGEGNLTRWLEAMKPNEAREVRVCVLEDRPCQDIRALISALSFIAEHLAGTSGAGSTALRGHRSLAGMGVA